MQEKYFPGFRFTQRAKRRLRFSTVQVNQPLGRELTTRIHLDDLFASLGMIDEDPIETWTRGQVKREFAQALNKLNKKLVYPELTMKNKRVYFVTPEQMKPKSAAETDYVERNYGDYLATTGGVGVSHRRNDGSFLIKIGHAGDETTTQKDQVMFTLAHEFGHSLGEHINDPVFEELKAEAFTLLFMACWLNVEKYQRAQIIINAVSEVAVLFLDQLLGSGVSLTAVLAHLIGDQFGESLPDDYVKHLR